MGLAPWGNKATAQEGITNIEELKLEDLLVITATLHEQSVLDAPAAVRAEVDPWGTEDGGAVQLMRRVKQRFDPAGACNAGIFVGGI